MIPRPRPGSARARWPGWFAPVTLLVLLLALNPLISPSAARADELDGTPTTVVSDEPEPTATDTPAPPATDTPLPPTDTPTPVPPTATATTAPTATPAPNSGPVAFAFTPGDFSVAAGLDLVRLATITNGDLAQPLNLTLSSTAGWVITVIDESTGAELASDRKRVFFSLPVLQPGETRTLVVRLAVPATADPGETDYLTIRLDGEDGVVASTTVLSETNPDPGDPAPDPESTPTPDPDEDEIEEEAGRSLTISGHGGSFGTMNMLGSIDPTIPDLTSTTDETGATYIKTGAVTVRIESDSPWALYCNAQGEAPNLTWRVTGTDAWAGFGSSSDPVVCASGEAGTTDVTFDLSLHVAIGGETGNLQSTIAFTLGE